MDNRILARQVTNMQHEGLEEQLTKSLDHYIVYLDMSELASVRYGDHPSALEGESFFYTSPDLRPSNPNRRPQTEALYGAVEASAGWAEELGAQVVHATPGQPIPERMPLLNYPLPDVAPDLSEVEQAVRDAYPNMMISAFPFAKMSAEELIDGRLHEGPVVVANRNAQRGVAKYLLTSSEQVGRFVAYCDNNPDTAREFDVRPYIDTVGSRYSSWRIVTSAAGRIISAALTVSGHEKQTALLDQGGSRITDQNMRAMVDAFENPDSPYYLESLDIGSSGHGLAGATIPLMGGEYAAKVSEEELELARACGLNELVVPQNMATNAQVVAKLTGYRRDIILGMDFITDSRQAPCLEANAGPGALTYNMCWLGGRTLTTEAHFRQRRAALQSMAYPTVSAEEFLRPDDPWPFV